MKRDYRADIEKVFAESRKNMDKTLDTESADERELQDQQEAKILDAIREQQIALTSTSAESP